MVRRWKRSPAGWGAVGRTDERAEALLGLFREAVDLRPPDPHTGIW
jgi:hypothetical protein